MHISGRDNQIEYNANTTVFVHPSSNMQEMNRWKENIIAILQQVPSEADALKPLIQFIVAILDPYKIYILKNGGNTSTSPDTYIDLLIIVPDNENILSTELAPVFEIACLKHPRVCCSLHSADKVQAAMARGNIFYTMNCIDKNLVYDDERLSLPVTTNRALRNLKLQAEVAFTLSFKKALFFYQSAVFIQENHSEPIVAFYLHQSIELTYRSILRSLNGYYKKTHVIRSLKDLACRCAPQLNAVLPDNTKHEKHLLDVLENAYLNSRYDNQYTIDDDDLRILFERTKRVLDTAQEMIEQTITDIPTNMEGK